MRRSFQNALVAAVVVSNAAARADVNTTPAVARGSGGQPAVTVAFDAKGQLHASVCAHAPCGADRSIDIPVPEEAARRATSARLRIVGIGLDRRAVVVDIPDTEAGSAWTAVVSAPLSGDKPLVPWSGYTGRFEGLEGERSASMVVIADTVYVGTETEGKDLCGRRAILEPKALDPKTLALVSAKLQRLSEKEREAATAVEARPVTGDAPPRILLPAWATSAAPGTSVGNLVDGKAETIWAEGRGGAGRGEFAVLRGPREVPIRSFEITVGSAKTTEHAAVPRDLYVATDRELFKVTLPADAARAPSGRYEVSLPSAVRTSCVGVVLESTSSEDKDARVGIAEFAARPEIAASPAELVDRIASGGPEAEAAAAVLRAGDRSGFEALALRFAALDENARRTALDVLDDAPCDVAAPAYVEALAGPYDAQRLHARAAFSRCAEMASPIIAAALPRVARGARATLVEELAEVAPGALVGAVLPILGKAKSVDRRIYRAGIARAAAAARARGYLAKALADEALGSVATVDVLRALGDMAPAFGNVAHSAFVRVSGDPSFRNRYLLLGPAAALAHTDASARAFLRSAIGADSDPRIRAEASRSVRNPREFYPELARGLDDRAVRVREASALALGAGRIDESATALSYRMKVDAWPLVRRAAVRALSELGRSSAIDGDLGNALLDDSPDVRREVLRAIALRGARSEVEKVRERFADKEEVDSVRSAAALALGRLCDTASVDALTKRAVKLATPMTDETDRLIGRGALTALSLIGPTDLEKRLQPFWAKGVPRPITELARVALAAPGWCNPKRGAGGNVHR